MILLQIIVFLSVLISLVEVQKDCESGSCHPTIGDLLVGRSEQLISSSTCGQDGPQKYCIIGYLEDEQKCFNCDSRNPYNPYTQPNSHLVENIITTFEPDWKKKWWQSENGMDHVCIRLDLETLFQFSHLILTFKTFRPAAMLVERSRDFGKTWKVFRYFAQNCASSFPDVTHNHAEEVGDIVCDSKYSDIEPSTEGEVVLKALDPSFDIENPYDPYIQDLITITNLRINFTKLHTLGDTLSNRWQSEPLEKYYYAVYEMVVRGNCFCNGHASQCVPVQNMRNDAFNQPGMVHGRCVCQHNTDGLNCEKCQEFYYDAPWRPAVGLDDQTCRRCNCNRHSETCHFDTVVFMDNNGTSGGVCENCQHKTMGNQCELCKPYFYHDPLRDISDPFTCIPCDCDQQGTQENGICQCHTDHTLGTTAGTCLCKENVEGIRCDQCKSGFFGLSATDPIGCQYCNCNPFGSLPFSICDPVTGACQCQQFATGRYCEECISGYWGLGNSLYSCSPCNCDIGGARSHLCSSSNGHCECLPNIMGLQCNEPAPGYFFIPLDYYIYEAEHAQPLARSASIVNPSPLPKCKDYFLQQGIDFRFENGRIILKKMKKRSLRRKRQAQEIVPFGTNGAVELVLRQPTLGNPVTWTGPGFARVLNGAGLRFTAKNIPYAMDFIIAIRYEPETLEDWTASIVVNSPKGSRSEHCKNKLPLNNTNSIHLDSTYRLALLNTSICLDPETEYLIDVYFTQLSNVDSSNNFYILIDSLGLIPKIGSVNNLCSKQELEEYQYYNCIAIASEVGTEILPDVCERLIISMSARMHNGAVKCTCNVDGSLSTSCSKFGGRCECKLNVVGRCCDRCAVGSYSFGPNGCQECDCHSKGSMSTFCDQVTGQCACRSEIHGRRCDSCLPGYYGFPNCRPCQCNSNSEPCDPVTGTCLDCKGFTTGTNCERCLDNYFGNPILRQPCRPCMCPESPTSNQYFARSCHQDPDSLELVCSCLEGYTGSNCNECPIGFYGNIEEGEDRCLPCLCNNNIDVTDAESCDKVTGACLKCLYNTYGTKCDSCLPGYFGSALLQSCRRCACNPLGTHVENCSIYDEVGECVCDRTTGQCPCLPNVIGTSCDTCAPGYWDMASGKGCQPCDCNLNNSLGNQCNQFTGQCFCKSKYKGRKCDQCDDNYYGDPKVQCISCKCNLEGTQSPVCDNHTGSCNCRVGVTGRYCEICAPGFKQEFPACPRCHLCFDPWDNEMLSLSEAVDGLVKLTANIGPNRDTQLGCDVQMKILEDKLSVIEKIVQSPILSPAEFLKIKSYYDNLRRKVSRFTFPNLGQFSEIPKMNKTIWNMEKEINDLFKELDKIRKKKVEDNKLNSKVFIASYDKISMHYKTSLSAAQKARNATPVIQAATKKGKNILTMLSNLAVKDKLNSDKLDKMKLLDVNKLNEMVCGTVWNFACDVAPCGGALCRDKFGKRKCGGPNCNGALPFAKDALKKAKETGVMFNNVTIQLLQAGKQIDNIRKVAEDTMLKASKLNKTLTTAMNRMKADKNRTKELIKNVKDFLLDAFVSPEDIENVANQILAIKLPAAPYDLINMLNKVKKYCDDYKNNKNSLREQLDQVKKLTLEAKEAKKDAENLPNGDEIRNNLNNAENTQKRTTAALKRLNNDIQEIRKKLSQAKTKADMTDDKLKAIKDLHSQLETKIAELQDKMLQNREQATDAQKGAESALKEATESENSLNNLMKKYDLLKEKLKKKDIPPEILERLEKLKEDAKDLSNEIDSKFKRISDLEMKIDDLNEINQDKADQLKQLEEQVIGLKNNILEQENKHATCKS
ncbi:laminin subunit beta-4 isoform X2 [Ascaphus truei]|uniref:laminin subunit beta-4 isoform X2 n=1 Tax=Ascaphus truei TaxID=8439 RepID=UPI003F5A0AC8